MASVFTMIINGDLPGHFIWKDQHCVALLTIQPMKDGHALVIPREEISHWDDLSEALAQHLMTVAQRIAKACKHAFSCERVGMIIAGFEVPHTHLHVVPVNEMNDLSFANAHDESQATLADNARRLRESLLALGYTQARID